MSTAEFVQHMKEKDKKPMEDATASPCSSSSSSCSRGINIKKCQATRILDCHLVHRVHSSSREASMASTVRYPSRGPEPEPPRAQLARTIARKELGRSRSRGGPHERILPIVEDERPRGKRMTKPEGPMAGVEWREHASPPLYLTHNTCIYIYIYTNVRPLHSTPFNIWLL